MRHMFIILMVVTIITGLKGYADDNSDEENNKIKDLFERIEEEKEKEEKKEDEDEDDTDKKRDDDDDESGIGGCIGKALGGCLSGCIEEMSPVFFELLIAYIFLIRYTDYPFSPETEYDFSFIQEETKETEGQIGILKCSGDAAYLMYDRFAFSGKIEANISLLHANFFFQYMSEQPYWFTILSVNGGISIPVFNFMITGYIGGFSFGASQPGATIEEMLLSYGGSLNIFFFHNIYLDLFNLNAHYGSLGFHYVSGTLNYCIGLLSIGMGYNLNLYAYNYDTKDGLIFQGPYIKISLWL